MKRLSYAILALVITGLAVCLPSAAAAQDATIVIKMATLAPKGTAGA